MSRPVGLATVQLATQIEAAQGCEFSYTAFFFVLGFLEDFFADL
jgi:hypothetical protein